eukprot:1149501-Pelagomonas_calceolata.AAC.5
MCSNKESPGILACIVLCKLVHAAVHILAWGIQRNLYDACGMHTQYALYAHKERLSILPVQLYGKYKAEERKARAPSSFKASIVDALYYRRDHPWWECEDIRVTAVLGGYQFGKYLLKDKDENALYGCPDANLHAQPCHLANTELVQPHVMSPCD